MNNELYHYGVLGMKWGVRRYQNKDGSYTSAGKKRLAADAERRLEDYRKVYGAADTKAKAYARKVGSGKSISELEKLAETEANKDGEYRLKREKNPNKWDEYTSKAHDHEIRSNEFRRMISEKKKRNDVVDKIVSETNGYLMKEREYDGYRSTAKEHVDRFSKSSSPVHKFLTKTNTFALNLNTSKRDEYKQKADAMIKQLHSEDNVVVRITPYGPLLVRADD